MNQDKLKTLATDIGLKDFKLVYTAIKDIYNTIQFTPEQIQKIKEIKFKAGLCDQK